MPMLFEPPKHLLLSKAEQKAAEESGDWQVLEQAGAKDGERAISASNRNFVGRLGSRVRTEAYLGSPEVVAASAIRGKIAGPNWYHKPEGVDKVIIGEGTGDFAADKATAVMDGFEKLLSEMDGAIAAAECPGDDSTAEPSSTAAEEELSDVLPGKVYLPASKEQMAEVCMENYDPDFGKIAKPGDILVGGYNFGTGSSRDQAATSILAKQIPLVIAASFSNIFSRNSK
ncbi:hypothetical protein ACJ41O_004561 [Fusarium nematophilum]